MKITWFGAVTALISFGLGIVLTLALYLLPAGGATVQDSTLESGGAAGEVVNEHMVHGHGMVMVDMDEPIPSVDLVVHPDGHDSGWNLEFRTENFRFSPEKVNGTHVNGEGHAHLYIDGVKFTRLYSEWFFLGPEHLPTGEHKLTVTLNANDHSEYMLGDRRIEDSESFIVFQE